LIFRLAISVFICGLAIEAAEADANQLSQNLLSRHLPFYTVMDPFVTEDNQVRGYTRCGDSATWTGHWLAAETFRYRVTKDPQALHNVFVAMAGIRELVDVTGRDQLARCFVPVDSPYAQGILDEEASNKNYPGRCLNVDCWWVGNTSRDTYLGVFFGLGVAWEFSEVPWVREQAAAIVTRLLNRLDEDDWAVKMPDGETSTVFWHRADQRLMMLLVGSKVNNGRFGSKYSSERFLGALTVSVPVAAEVLDPHNSYFKFNLDAITFYTLIRFENNSTWRGFYENAYGIFRRTVDDHGNAHFNMIDRALQGANAARDAESRALLEQWLERPRLDVWVDHRGTLPQCGDEDQACDPIPVPQRVTTDFLWQRSPYLLYGGRAGDIETAGIDYLLPYWMGRFYGVFD
jgi:hypothetical protein